MSATEIINELAKLTEADRRKVLKRLLALEEKKGSYVDLRARGIDKTQAIELRARLKTFAEDWDRPEAAIYDEDPAR